MAGDGFGEEAHLLDAVWQVFGAFSASTRAQGEGAAWTHVQGRGGKARQAPDSAWRAEKAPPPAWPRPQHKPARRHGNGGRGRSGAERGRGRPSVSAGWAGAGGAWGGPAAARGPLKAGRDDTELGGCPAAARAGGAASWGGELKTINTKGGVGRPGWAAGCTCTPVWVEKCTSPKAPCHPRCLWSSPPAPQWWDRQEVFAAGAVVKASRRGLEMTGVLRFPFRSGLSALL